ncbi:50S ribosomal protein L23 [Caldisphaera sp.]|uniref:50S ribosomal protein L23 n=1 Tax=Caldisphaera sp. TaxID=2060322 RepID=UPI0025C32C8C|nr:50S ribosomal protein L23 [Caldisphaera sp.]
MEEIILKIVMSEKASRLMEESNTLTFIVARDANKQKIREAIENLYNVKVESVKTLITPRGEKKAMVRLSKEYKATDIATKFGLL